MNEVSKNITKLTAGLALQNKSREELAEIVDRYPYFGFTQFLLAQKLNDEHNANATKQLQHAALYFSNPFWMDYLWRENNASVNVETSEKKISENNFSAEEVVVTDEVKENNA